jgi:hypothetical protein
MRTVLLALLVLTFARTADARQADLAAFVRFMLSKVVAPASAKGLVTGATSATLFCVTVDRFDMRQLGWRRSIGAGCANRTTGEVIGAIIAPNGIVRCTFTGSYDESTGCAVTSGCGSPVQVCMQ